MTFFQVMQVKQGERQPVTPHAAAQRTKPGHFLTTVEITPVHSTMPPSFHYFKVLRSQIVTLGLLCLLVEPQEQNKCRQDHPELLFLETLQSQVSF